MTNSKQGVCEKVDLYDDENCEPDINGPTPEEEQAEEEAYISRCEEFYAILHDELWNFVGVPELKIAAEKVTIHSDALRDRALLQRYREEQERQRFLKSLASIERNAEGDLVIKR